MPVRSIVDCSTTTAVSSDTGYPFSAGKWRPVGPALAGPTGLTTGDVLLEQLRLVRARHLRGEVDVAGQVALASDRVRRPADRVLEHRRFELLGRRGRPAAGQGDRPVDGEAGV